jgi:hypothetical protein
MNKLKKGSILALMLLGSFGIGIFVTRSIILAPFLKKQKEAVNKITIYKAQLHLYDTAITYLSNLELHNIGYFIQKDNATDRKYVDSLMLVNEHINDFLDGVIEGFNKKEVPIKKQIDSLQKFLP